MSIPPTVNRRQFIVTTGAAAIAAHAGTAGKVNVFTGVGVAFALVEPAERGDVCADVKTFRRRGRDFIEDHLNWKCFDPSDENIFLFAFETFEYSNA